jgi:hypothetical protein
MTGPTIFFARAYRDAGDLIRLEEFLLEIVGTRTSHTGWHIGSLLWSMSYHTQPELQRTVQMWEDATGGLQALAWFEEPNLVQQAGSPYRVQATNGRPVCSHLNGLAV